LQSFDGWNIGPLAIGVLFLTSRDGLQ